MVNKKLTTLGLISALALPISAQPTPLEKDIRGSPLENYLQITRNPEILETDLDGKVYGLLNMNIDIINGFSQEPSKYISNFVSSHGTEPLYGNLNRAIKQGIYEDTKYVVEFDRKYYGVISAVYKLDGSKLFKKPNFLTPKCICRPNPSFFMEKKEELEWKKIYGD